MKQFFSLLILCGILHLGSCKKEECPEPEVYYTSTMAGENFQEVRFVLEYLFKSEDGWCEGWFIREVYQHGIDNTITGNFKIQVVEGIPDALKKGGSYFGKEFFIDLEFIGVGYECRFYEDFDDGPNNPYKRNIELVKILKIVEAP